MNLVVQQPVWVSACVAVTLFSALLVLHVEDVLPPGDSGELLVCIQSRLTPHPPGYPLFIALYHTVTVALPSWLNGHDTQQEGDARWSLTYRCNVLTAAIASTAVGLMVLSALSSLSSHHILHITNQTATITAVVLICFMHGFTWLGFERRAQTLVEMSTEVEVFALHWLLSSLQWFGFVCVVVLRDGKSCRLTALGGWCAVTVLTSCHQHLSILFSVPQCVAIVLLSATAQLGDVTWRSFCCMLLVTAVAGVTLSALLFRWVLVHDDWFAWGGADSWEGWWQHVTRQPYGAFRLHSGRGPRDVFPWDIWVSVQEVYRQWLVDTVGFSVLVCACVGVVSSLWGADRKRRVLSVVAVGMWLCSTACFHAFVMNLQLSADDGTPLFVHRHVMQRLWTGSLLPVMYMASVGILSVVTALSAVNNRRCSSACLLALFTVSCCCYVPACLLRTCAEVSQPRAATGPLLDAYGVSALSGLAPGGIVITSGDMHLTALRHAQRIRNIRRDVVLIDWEMAQYDWFLRRVEWTGQTENNSSNKSTRVGVIWPKVRNNRRVSVYDVVATNVVKGGRTVYILDAAPLLKEAAQIKQTFCVVFQGWFHAVTKRCRKHNHLQHAHSSLSPSVPPLSQLPFPLLHFACLLMMDPKEDSRTLTWCTASDHRVRRATSPSGAYEPLVATDPNRLAELRPWDGLLREHYLLSFKNALLQVASTTEQSDFGDEARGSTLTAVAASSRHALHRSRFSSQPDTEASFQAAVQPFLQALESLHL